MIFEPNLTFLTNRRPAIELIGFPANQPVLPSFPCREHLRFAPSLAVERDDVDLVSINDELICSVGPFCWVKPDVVGETPRGQHESSCQTQTPPECPYFWLRRSHGTLDADSDACQHGAHQQEPDPRNMSDAGCSSDACDGSTNGSDGDISPDPAP